MSTITPIAANLQNALTLGLYTRQDYVKPHERDLYHEFCQTLYSELGPEGLLEQSLTAEISGASWRLRRCSAIEGDLADFASQDPLLDESNEKTHRSVERARAHAHTILHRSINQLRRLQTERACREAVNAIGPEGGIADHNQVTLAFNNYERGKHLLAHTASMQINAALASICNTPELTPEPAPPTAQTPRNALCPCRSGDKFKRCCGKNAPPVLGTARPLAA